jgi:hypothetical protein
MGSFPLKPDVMRRRIEARVRRDGNIACRKKLEYFFTVLIIIVIIIIYFSHSVQTKLMLKCILNCIKLCANKRR